MRGLPSILSLFHNEFNKSKNARARMLDSIYHMILRLLCNLIHGVKKVILLSLCTQRRNGRHLMFSQILVTTNGLSILIHSQTRRHNDDIGILLLYQLVEVFYYYLFLCISSIYLIMYLLFIWRSLLLRVTFFLKKNIC